MAAQTWDVTLLLYTAAAGYGNTVSSGYGDATAAQEWPVTLLDGAAAGYGNTLSAGYDDGAVDGAGEVVWYDIAVSVLVDGATRPFLAPVTVGNVLAPLTVGNVLAPLALTQSTAPLDVTGYLAPLDMETETA